MNNTRLTRQLIRQFENLKTKITVTITLKPHISKIISTINACDQGSASYYDQGSTHKINCYNCIKTRYSICSQSYELKAKKIRTCHTGPNRFDRRRHLWATVSRSKILYIDKCRALTFCVTGDGRYYGTFVSQCYLSFSQSTYTITFEGLLLSGGFPRLNNMGHLTSKIWVVI